MTILLIVKVVLILIVKVVLILKVIMRELNPLSQKAQSQQTKTLFYLHGPTMVILLIKGKSNLGRKPC